MYLDGVSIPSWEVLGDRTPSVFGISLESNTHPHHHFLSLRENLCSGLSLLVAASYEVGQS